MDNSGSDLHQSPIPQALPPEEVQVLGTPSADEGLSSRATADPSSRGSVLCQSPELLHMIKFEHTVFALPFALLGALMAAQGLPPWRTSLWILAAMVGARTAAMTFNR